jgi:hypothetical protein
VWKVGKISIFSNKIQTLKPVLHELKFLVAIKKTRKVFYAKQIKQKY